MDKPRVEVCEHRCDQCLFSKNRVVTVEAAQRIVAEALAKDKWFTCHKGSLADPPRDLVCNGFWELHRRDVLPLRLAVMLDLVTFVPVPDSKT